MLDTVFVVLTGSRLPSLVVGMMTFSRFHQHWCAGRSTCCCTVCITQSYRCLGLPWLATLLSGALVGFLSRTLVLVRFWGTRVGMARVPDDVSVDRLVRWMFVVCCGLLFLGLVAMPMQAYSSIPRCIFQCTATLRWGFASRTCPSPGLKFSSHHDLVGVAWTWVPRYLANCIFCCQISQFATAILVGMIKGPHLQVGLWHWWCCFNEHVRQQTPMHWEMRRTPNAVAKGQWLSPA